MKFHPCLSFLRVNTPIHPRHPLPLPKRVLRPLTCSRSHPRPALPKSRSLQLAVQSTQMRELPAASLKLFVPLAPLQQISLLNVDFLLHFHSHFVCHHSFFLATWHFKYPWHSLYQKFQSSRYQWFNLLQLLAIIMLFLLELMHRQPWTELSGKWLTSVASLQQVRRQDIYWL